MIHGGMMSNQQFLYLTKNKKSYSSNALDLLYIEPNANLSFMNEVIFFILYLI